MMGKLSRSNVLEIKGSATADKGFKKWVLEYGLGADPASWTVLVEKDKPVEDGLLYSWNVSNLPNGKISLRLTLVGDNAEVDQRITLNIDLPIPTSTPTQTPTPTPTPDGNTHARGDHSSNRDPHSNRDTNGNANSPSIKSTTQESILRCVYAISPTTKTRPGVSSTLRVFHYVSPDVTFPLTPAAGDSR